MSGVAVITGAASGIGAGLARHAAGRGMTVVLADRDAARLAEIAEGIGEGAIAVETDVTDPVALEQLAERAFAAGNVELLFNNAGVLTTGYLWEIPVDQWRAAVDVNVLGIVNGLRTFVPRLLAAGHRARIVNTASVGGFLPSPLMAPYSATKFAVVALTEALAGELAMQGDLVTASLLAPGPVRSDIFRAEAPVGSAGFVDTMRAMLASEGIDADEFAVRVFESIDRGEYWIIPQPEALDAGWHARNQAIATRRAPRFYLVDKDT